MCFVAIFPSKDLPRIVQEEAKKGRGEGILEGGRRKEGSEREEVSSLNRDTATTILSNFCFS